MFGDVSAVGACDMGIGACDTGIGACHTGIGARDVGTGACDVGRVLSTRLLERTVQTFLKMIGHSVPSS